MRRKGVESSDLRSVGYDPKNSVLEIRFNEGSIYRYYDVEPEVYKTLMDAPSKGEYFHQVIRTRYFYRCIKKHHKT